MPDLTVPLPEGYADLVDDFTTDHLRVELLRNGLLKAQDEIHRVAELELDDRPAEAVSALLKCIERIQWLTDELARLIPENER